MMKLAYAMRHDLTVNFFQTGEAPRADSVCVHLFKNNNTTFIPIAKEDKAIAKTCKFVHSCISYLTTGIETIARVMIERVILTKGTCSQRGLMKAKSHRGMLI